MKKERNYTIEFARFMFACNFILIHAYVVLPMQFGLAPILVIPADMIIPFMAFMGFFLMQGYKKKQAAGLTQDVSPSRQAWEHLKSRLLSLMPLYLFATLLGAISQIILQGIPVSQWHIYFMNMLGEFLGLQLSGFGLGGSLANGPLWFLSGVFLCGYFVYYLVAKNDKHFVAFIAPLVILLYYGSNYLTETLPIWTTYVPLGGFEVASGFINMFCGISIGVILWVACDNLKNKEWSRGSKVLLSVVQLICFGVILVRSWVSSLSPLGHAFDIGWGAAYLMCTVFTFLCLLNVDYITRLPFFRSKIWRVPGRLALYIYALHYPVLLFVGFALGTTAANPQPFIDNVHLIYGVTLAICIVLGYILLKFEEKILMPWLKNKPWFTREQAQLELAAE